MREAVYVSSVYLVDMSLAYEKLQNVPALNDGRAECLMMICKGRSQSLRRYESSSPTKGDRPFIERKCFFCSCSNSTSTFWRNSFCAVIIGALDCEGEQKSWQDLLSAPVLAASRLV